MVATTQQTLQSSTHLVNHMPKKKQKTESVKIAPLRNCSKLSCIKFLSVVVPWTILVAKTRRQVLHVCATTLAAPCISEKRMSRLVIV
jgi:hypothetical protein